MSITSKNQSSKNLQIENLKKNYFFWQLTTIFYQFSNGVGYWIPWFLPVKNHYYVSRMFYDYWYSSLWVYLDSRKEHLTYVRFNRRYSPIIKY
jgi:hypothetical protein